MALSGIFADAGWLGALGLGALTAIHPCFLSTSGTALAFLAEPGVPGSGKAWSRLARAGAMVSGMVAAHLALAMLLAGGVAGLPFLSQTLPALTRPFLPPLLILAGILMTGLLDTGAPRRLQESAERMLARFRGRALIYFPVGVLLALAFCPATAGLFFAVLIPMAIADGKPIVYALCFGGGHAAVLSVGAALLSMGVRRSASPRVWRLVWRGAGCLLVAVGTVWSFKEFSGPGVTR